MLFIVHREHRVGIEATQETYSVRVFDQERLQIGRGTQADLHFKDVGVDLRHASIEVERGTFVVRDQGSVTGTYLNGRRIESATLSVGDVIVIGDHPLMVRRYIRAESLELVLLPALEGGPSGGGVASEAATAGRALSPVPESEAPTEPGLPAPDFEELKRRAAAEREQSAEAGPTAPPAPAAAAQVAGASAVAAPKRRRKATFRSIDYVRIYGLPRLALSKTAFSIVSLLLAGSFVSWLVRAERRDLVQPGPLSSAHQLPILSGAGDCEECHEPRRGASSALCENCHPGPIHSVRQTSTLECIACHVEHRSAPRLTEVDERLCVDCHRSTKLADADPPIYEPSIPSFRRHPDFSLTVGPAGEKRRVSLAEAVEEKLDATVLAFNHALHLDPVELERQRPLDCSDCHVESADDRHMTIVDYQRNCEECHPLNFDRNYGPAPHEGPELVADHILSTYARARGESLQRTSTQRRLQIFRRSIKTLSVDERVERQAYSATERLFTAACDKCHELRESPEGFPPDVVPPEVPTSWLPHAEFPHGRHEQVDCEVCHPNVAQSRDTADVLLRGIETCRPCHGGFGEPEPETDSGLERRILAVLAAPKPTATIDCSSCHLYHDRSKAGEWAQSRNLLDSRSGAE